jgi:hypothetical protein
MRVAEVELRRGKQPARQVTDDFPEFAGPALGHPSLVRPWNEEQTNGRVKRLRDLSRALGTV